MATPDQINSADLPINTTELSDKSLDPNNISKIEDACTDPNQADKLATSLNTSLTTAIDDCSDPVVVNSIKGVIEESKKPATEDANKTPLIEAPKKTETVAPVFTKEFKGTNTGTTKEAYNEKSPQLEQAKLLIANSGYADLP